MARGKGINKEKLYRLASEGKSAQAIMRELDIKTKASLKSALAEVMMERGEVLQVPGIGGRRTGNRKFTKLGILIPRGQLEPQFKQGDTFEMEVTADKIVLSKVR